MFHIIFWSGTMRILEFNEVDWYLLYQYKICDFSCMNLSLKLALSSFSKLCHLRFLWVKEIKKFIS
mgnify:CR=1 FL=1